MFAVGCCMNRMILNAQKTFEGAKREEIVDNLETSRFDLIRNPLEKQKTAKAEKSAKQNGPSV